VIISLFFFYLWYYRKSNLKISNNINFYYFQFVDPDAPNNIEESSSKKRKGDKSNAPITRVRYSAMRIPILIQVLYPNFAGFRFIGTSQSYGSIGFSYFYRTFDEN